MRLFVVEITRGMTTEIDDLEHRALFLGVWIGPFGIQTILSTRLGRE